MKRIQVSEFKDYFTFNGKLFFYLADTVWSAFTNITLEEWEVYLEKRRSQNFNTLQISILPILHDSTESDLEIHPFYFNEKGVYDFNKINETYFERADRMLEIAVNKGFIPALVVLWCNYVKDTWGAKRNPEFVMPIERIKDYTKFIVKTFDRFNPIYIVSGDTKFETEDVIKYYKIVMESIKKSSSEAITTLHLAPNTELPQEIIYDKNLDFYMYQSGHVLEKQDNAYKHAQYFYNLSEKRPIINGEPPYEGHGHGFRYGRFTNFDIRKAMWQSILSGAKAGITYGAHGVWSWHKRGREFNGKDFSSMPFSHETALELKGAWDAGYIRWIYENYQLYDVNPYNEKLFDSKGDEIRLAASQDLSKVIVYMPYSTELNISIDISGYHCVMHILDNNLIIKPLIVKRGEVNTVLMEDVNSDILFVAIRKQ